MWVCTVASGAGREPAAHEVSVVRVFLVVDPSSSA
jgi:hypothetical protein